MNNSCSSIRDFSVWISLALIGYFWLLPEISHGQPVIQREFDRNYGGIDFEECRVAHQTRDSGFVLLGRTTSDAGLDISQPTRDNPDIVFDPVGINRGDFWLLRLNKNGIKMWDSRYGGDKLDVGKAIIETNDGYILGGSSNSIISGDKTIALKGGNNDYWTNSDYWLIKVDQTGNKMWEQAYGGDLYEDLVDMIPTSDGGILIIGISASDISVDKTEPSRGSWDWWIVKTDMLGNILWEKTIGGDQPDILHDVIETTNGNYILSGQVFSGATGDFTSANLGSSDGLLMEIDPNGNILWQQRFGGDGEDSVNRIYPTSDGGYILGCQSDSNPNVQKTGAVRGGRDLWVVKVNSDASIIEWENTFGSTALENLHSIKQNTVDHFIVGGFTSSGQGGDVSETSRGSNDFWILYLDPDGNKKWDKRFGGSSSDVLFNIFQANDGGYMITGHSESSISGDKQTANYGQNDFWILKTQCILDIDFGGDNTVCLGDSIILNAYDPNCEGCIFDWWDGRDNDSIRTVKPTIDGSYAVTLTDCVGCQTQESINVNVLQPPSIELGADVEICPGSSQSFSPGNNSDWTYLWSTGETTSTIQVTTAGTYSVTVTDAQGCSSEDQVSATLHDLSITKSVVNTTCRESNGSASIQVSGGTGNYNISWSNGGSGNIINDLPSGKYIATVNDGFCQVEVEVIIGFEEEPEVEWQSTFGGSRIEQGRESFPTDDGGYIVVGGSSSTDGDVTVQNGTYDFWVIKLDASGAIVWENSYGGTGNEKATAVEQTNDGGYIIAGESNSSNGDVANNNGELDYWVIKIDGGGNLQWENNFGGTKSEEARDVIQTFDGGYLVAGYTSSDDVDVNSNNGSIDIWIVKLDGGGSLQWEQNYGSTNNDGGFIKVKQTQDGGFAISGTNSTNDGDVTFNNGSIDFWLIKTDGKGNLLWEKSYGGSGIDLSYALDLTADGGFILAGATDRVGGDVMANYGQNDFWVLKLDKDGNILWERNYGGTSNDRVWSIKSLDDGGYVMTGSSNSNDIDITGNIGQIDYWVVKIDAIGDIVWEQNYGGTSNDRVYHIHQANDGGFILSGDTESNDGTVGSNNGQRDYWVLKLNVPPPPELELGDDLITCPGDEVSFDISDPTCINCTYLWNDGDTNPTRLVYPTDDTKYVVTITDRFGCSVSDSLLVDPIPIPPLELGVDTAICDGATLSLNAGNGTDQYLWSTNETTATIVVDAASEYRVTVTNAAGCTIADTIQLSINPLPTVSLGGDITVCQNEEVVLDAFDPSCVDCAYQWSDDLTDFDSIRTIIASSDMTIEVTVEDANGCINTDEINITIIPLPNGNLNINSIDPGPHCPESSFDITLNDSESGIEYQLTDGDNPIGSSLTGDGGTLVFPTGNLNTTDTFYIIAANPSMCTDTISTNIIINIGDVELPTISCPNNQSYSITNQDCNYIVNNLEPTAGDNCEVVSITYELTGATTGNSPLTGMNDASGTTFNIGSTAIKYIITDNSGNQDSCSFSIEIIDASPPVISTEASSQTVQCDGNGNLTDFNNWLNSNGGAIANDACGNISWSTNPVSPSLSDGCGETGTVEVTFIATDENNNNSSTTATFTIEDTEAPSFSVPADITIDYFDDEEDFTLSGNVSNLTDACDNNLANASYSDEIVSEPCQDIITRTWRLVDACDNENIQIQTITKVYEAATATISGGATLCGGDSTDLVFNFSTNSNFDVVYTNGQSNFTLENIQDGHSERISPLSSGTFEIASVTDRQKTDCPVNFSGSALITVNNLAQIDNGSIEFLCDELNATFSVSFKFIGGVPSNVSITDDNGDPTGSFSNGTFTSNVFNSGSSYAIVIDDGSTCDPIRLEGTYDCPCNNTVVGNLVADPITVCGNEFPSLSYDNSEVLDGNDVLQFVLHDGSSNPIGNTIAVNSTPEFSFTNLMSYGTPYYVTAIVGTATNSGLVNLNDVCASYSSSVSITFYEFPEAVIASNDLILSCATNSLSLNGSQSTSGQNITYQWTTPDGRITSGQNASNVIVEQPGIYELTVTNTLSGCSSSASVEVKPDEDLPIVNIESADTLSCKDNVVVLDASGSSIGNNFEYSWAPINGGNIISGETTLTPEVDETGIYQLLIRDLDKNCTSAATIEVFENIAAPNADAGLPGQFDCVTTEIALDGTNSSIGADFIYEWSTNDGSIQSGANTLQPVITSSGTYVLEVTDLRNGCTAADEVLIPVNEDFPSDAILDVQDPRCFGDQYGSILFESVVGGQGPFRYTVDGELYVPNPLFSNLEPGIYSVGVRDANNCEWSSSITITAPEELNVELGDNHKINLGDSVKLEAQVSLPRSRIMSLNWSPDMNPDCTKCFERTVMPPVTTEYNIKVEDDNGCTDSDKVTVFVSKEQLVFVPTGFSPNDDGNNDIFYIHAGTGVKGIKLFRIYNRWGGGVFEAFDIPANDPNYGWDGTSKGERLNAAVFVYYAEIEFDDGSTEIFKGDITLLR